jgi:hypothetical protein
LYPEDKTKMRLNSPKLPVLIALISLLLPGLLAAQSTTNGAISGTVTDATGAILPDITVNLKSTEKGFANSTKTNSQGVYQFPLLEPGNYAITISAPSFKTSTLTTTVSVGVTSTVNAKLEVGAAGTTVEVTSEAAMLQTESAEISTTFNSREISEVPNPGNDLTYVAQTAAGSVMNTGMGAGNFASFGVSASSNLFTLNGMYNNDPFLNLNNSGATNLLLGNNEVQEATVVTNGYSGQYGGFAGANVNYITKSGSNNWHGNANYWWDGSAMNANNFFNVGNDTPRPFENANQYAASFGGPIKKDKAFFFVNYEGLRVILPTSSQVLAPTPSFQNYILDNLNNTGLSQSVPFYQNDIFNIYNTAQGVSRAVPGVPTASDTSGCQGQTYSNAAGTFGAGNLPCAESWRGIANNFTHEYLASGRFDFNLTNNDRVFVRLQEDKGVQATFTDQLNPIFNGVSTQPEYQGQVSWNRAFGVKAANNLVVSDQYYSAIFSTLNFAATRAAFPTDLIFDDNSLTPVGGADVDWPEGRNVTGYQLVDDFSYNLGSQHTLKLGVYFHRNLISDFDDGILTVGELVPLSLNDFAYGGVGTDGGTTLLNQTFPTAPDQDIKLYQLGWYLQDEWKIKSNLKLTLALRGDHNSIPTCQANCFARLSAPFAEINPAATIPYNQVIQSGQSQALQHFTTIAWQPRFGFTYSPSGLKNTVFRGGIGLFMDTFPGQIADGLSENTPVENFFPFTITGNLAPTQQTGGNVFNSAAVTNSAINSGFSQGQTVAQIAANATANGGQFSPPGFFNANGIQAPRYWEWNFEVQRAIGNNTTITVNYVGNHGFHETGQFDNENAYCPASSLTGPSCPVGFIGLPASAPDSRFGGVTQVQTIGVSNYNGLTVSAQHRFSRGLQIQANYSFSHALDEISNGGFNGFIAGNENSGRLGSFENPISTTNLRQFNYGNADYDTRHYLSMNYVYELPKGPSAFLKGWQVSGTLFARSGMPYTVANSGASGALGEYNYQSAAFANYSGPSSTPGCSSPSSTTAAPCLSAADFPDLAAGGNVGQNQLNSGTENQQRNQFFGPRYFSTDMTIMKYTTIPHWESAKLGIGAQFFNLFNHPNFESPVNDINSANFGQVLDTVNTPTSILGSGLGADASPRLIQLTAKFTF